MGEHFKYVRNTDCEYFPCHTTDKPEEFSCLFCYCPLYAMGRDCGGNFSFTKTGVKDCTNCLVPHKIGNYDYVTGKIKELYKRLQEEEVSAHPELYPESDGE